EPSLYWNAILSSVAYRTTCVDGATHPTTTDATAGVNATANAIRVDRSACAHIALYVAGNRNTAIGGNVGGIAGDKDVHTVVADFNVLFNTIHEQLAVDEGDVIAGDRT